MERNEDGRRDRRISESTRSDYELYIMMSDGRPVSSATISFGSDASHSTTNRHEEHSTGVPHSLSILLHPGGYYCMLSSTRNKHGVPIQSMEQ
jgi:hypothetical protein